jgi:tetratricopeptide (TPR) repeat protein
MLRLSRYLTALVALALVTLAGGGCTKEMRKNRHLSRGNGDFELRRYDQAEIEYLKVLQVAPLYPVAIRQLGIIYLEQGKLPRAHAFLLKAAELEPQNIETHLKLSMSYLSLRDFKKAAQEAAWVLAKQPGRDQALELLAESAATPKTIQETQEQIENLRRADQDRAAYHVAFGILWARAREPAKAEAELKKALDMDPKSSAALSVIGGIYWSRNDLTNAEQALKSAAQLSPLRSPARLKYAEFKVQTGAAGEAKKALEEITRNAPDCLPAWNFLAQLALSEKKYDECKTILQRVLARDSSNYDALFLSGTLQLEKGAAAQAVAEFTRLSNLYDRSPQVQYHLARAHLLNGDTAKAMLCLKKAITADPNFADAILLRANLSIRQGDAAEAIASLTELVKRQPQIPQAHLLLANAYLVQKDPDQAEAVCRRMREIFPKSPEVTLLLGSLLVRQNKRSEARQAFQQSLELFPDYLPVLEQIVDLDLGDRQFATATDRVQKQIDKHPAIPETWLLLAKIHIAQARGYVETENQKSTDLPRGKLRLADVKDAQADVTQAEAALLKAIDLNPGLTTPYLMLADLYVASGKQQQALERLNSLLVKTNDLIALMQVGILQDSQTNYPAARDAYEKLLTLNPNFSPALNNLAYLYLERFGQPEKAYQMSERARQLLPYNPATADTLGWILFKRGEFPRAIGLLEESAAKLPTDPEIQYHLGMTHYMLGDEAPARLALQQAAQHPKDFPGKATARGRLAILSIDVNTADAAAVSLLEKELRETPQDPVALLRLGGIEERDGAANKAAESYQAALKFNPQNSQIMLKLAQLYSSSTLSDPQKALSLAKAAHDLAPDNAQISSLLGRLAYQTGDYKWAVSLLQESSRRLPTNPEVSYDLAWAYYSLGRVPEAVSKMQSAAQAGPSFANAEQAGRFLATVAAANDPLQANRLVDDVQKTLRNDPNYVPGLIVSAVLQRTRGDYQLAAKFYDQALAHYPLFTPAARDLAILCFERLGDDQKAYGLASKAREALPLDADIAKVLGVLSYRKGSYTRAVQLLKESAEVRKEDGELLYYLGMAQYRLKDKTESKAALVQALALNVQPKLAADAKRVLAEFK